ncbi:MAG: aminoglycoside phosphotransferase family protein [Clostridia bacterium]|nr:aminoglycoside phosphotransferase family protein [Clostridia bacterium]
MVYNRIKNILPVFRFEGSYMKVEEMTSGNINSTYHLFYRGRGGKVNHYTLQNINNFVFKDPKAAMNNITVVTEHLRESFLAEGLDPERRVLELIATKTGETLHVDQFGSYWRAYRFIDKATPYDEIVKPEHFYEAGRAFGEFQKRLSDFPAEMLVETLPDFHNTTKRFYAFVAAVAADAVGRVAEVEDEIEYVFEHRKMSGEIVKLLAKGELPLRVTHNDTKLNNVLIDDETDKAICVIDLDTVMPGCALYDFGDAIRFGASTAAEDEEDTSKISLDMDLYRRFTEGFLSQVVGFLTEEEILRLPLGVKVITCELLMRFLTDYINGDTYFKVNSPRHNLIRTHAQMALLDDIERKYDQMQAIVEECYHKELARREQMQ